MEKKKLNILVTGSSGQLGRCLKDASKESDDCWMFFDHKDLDISNLDNVESVIYDNFIDVVVNCAAFTNVEKCEDRSYFDIVHNTNITGPENIASVLKKIGGTLIHISSDYVFGGTRKDYAYDEYTDFCSPLNTYGRSKMNAERRIRTVNGNFLIIRTGWLYSEYGNNFMLTMMDKFRTNESVNVVINQIGTPTYAGDLANFIVHIIEERKDVVPEKSADTIQEVYHYTNEGVASWYDFACAIKEYGNFNVDVKPCYDFDLHYKAERPSFSVLDKSKVKNTFGIKIPYWRDSLNTCITKLMSNK